MTRITLGITLFLPRLLNTLGARVQGTLSLGLLQQFLLRLGVCTRPAHVSMSSQTIPT